MFVNDIISGTKPSAKIRVHPYPYENLMVQNNVIHAAHQSGVQKLLFLGSSCSYPREVPQPMREEMLMMGYLESESVLFFNTIACPDHN